MHEELQVLAVSHMSIERALTQVEELLQLVGTVGSIGDVYLAVALDILIVHIIVVLRISKHLLQVVIATLTCTVLEYVSPRYVLA